MYKSALIGALIVTGLAFASAAPAQAKHAKFSIQISSGYHNPVIKAPYKRLRKPHYKRQRIGVSPHRSQLRVLQYLQGSPHQLALQSQSHLRIQRARENGLQCPVGPVDQRAGHRLPAPVSSVQPVSPISELASLSERPCVSVTLGPPRFGAGLTPAPPSTWCAWPSGRALFCWLFRHPPAM